MHALETHPTSSLVSQLTSRTDDVVTCKINVIRVCCVTPCRYNARCLEGNAADCHPGTLGPKKGWRQALLVSGFPCTLYGPCVSHAFSCYSVFFPAVYINTSPEKSPCLTNQSLKCTVYSRHLDTRNNHSVQCSPRGHLDLSLHSFILCWAVFTILHITFVM